MLNKPPQIMMWKKAIEKGNALFELLGKPTEFLATGEYRMLYTKSYINQMDFISKTLLLSRLEELEKQNYIDRLFYQKHAQTCHFVFKDSDVVIHYGNVDNWGFVYWLSTGPQAANEWLMAHAAKTMGYSFEKNRTVWLRNKALSIPDELALFELFGMPYIAPRERTIEKYQELWNIKGYQVNRQIDIKESTKLVPIQKGLF